MPTLRKTVVASRARIGEERAAPRRPWIAFVASATVPPVGHLYAGAPWRGVVVGGAARAAAFGSLLAALHGEWPATVAALVALPVVLAVPGIDAWAIARRAGSAYTRRPYNRWYVYVLVALAVGLVGEYVVPLDWVRAYRIPADSMRPTLVTGDHVLVDERAFAARAPERFDVVVFAFPPDPAKTFVKRVIGLPGETVDVRADGVWIDGVRLDEPYAIGSSGGGRGVARQPIRVAPGQYFVMGDDREHSYDSRYWGTVGRDAIRGRAQVVSVSLDPAPGRLVRWERTGMRVR